MENYIFILEILGIIAFAVTGAIEGIRSGMDLLGVIILGIITALGGGLIRDVFLGIRPAYSFQKPVYIYVAISTAVIVFGFSYYRQNVKGKKIAKIFEELLLFFDSMGLSLFTILGINMALSLSKDYTSAFYIFIGVITGVGGGVVRDLLTMKMPYILVRNIYASASIIGATIYLYLIKSFMDPGIAMILAMFVIFTIRTLAAKRGWNLPKVERNVL
ncbi:MAG: trimeric intracellular cation channel family protein [Tissierellia bacterium]|nr:trimeric intracellular cation channel family protein [Tissierellia bacterium]